MDKERKKTLTISSDLKKKIDTTSISTSGKKSFSVEKKRPFRATKSFNKGSSATNLNINPEVKKNIESLGVYIVKNSELILLSEINGINTDSIAIPLRDDESVSNFIGIIHHTLCEI